MLHDHTCILQAVSFKNLHSKMSYSSGKEILNYKFYLINHYKCQQITSCCHLNVYVFPPHPPSTKYKPKWNGQSAALLFWGQFIFRQIEVNNLELMVMQWGCLDPCCQPFFLLWYAFRVFNGRFLFSCWCSAHSLEIPGECFMRLRKLQSIR